MEKHRKLRQMSDAELWDTYDAIPWEQVPLPEDVISELDRRASDRAAAASAASEAASLKLARGSYVLSVISALTSVAAFVVAVATLVVTT